ncbi:MAG: VPLPA-CTERM sorting domain-containing protein [Paracoccaceae bacterium]
MKHTAFVLSVTAALTTTTAYAATLNAESQLTQSHSWLINSGHVPTGIVITNLSNTFETESDAATSVDDPTAIETSTNNFVVGNPFSDPIVPVDGERINITTIDGGTPAAAATFRYTIEIEDDPDDDEFGITRRDITQFGSARVSLEDNPVDGSASASHLGRRSYRLDNTTNQTISFNLAGAFSTEMSSVIEGANGFARTSGGFEILFDVGVGSSVNYFPIAPYLTSFSDDDSNATVSEQLLTNEGGISGISFGASTTAIGDGGFTEALFSGESRYIFGISIDPGTSLLMQTSFRQSNSVLVEPTTDFTPVPLPANFPLMIAGLAGFAVLRRKRKLN